MSDTTEQRSRPLRLTRIPGDTLILAAVLLYGLIIGTQATAGGAVALLATVVLVVGVTRREHRDRTAPGEAARQERGLLAGIVVFGVQGLVGWVQHRIGPSSILLERSPGILWIALGFAALRLGRRGGATKLVIAATTLAATLVFGFLHVIAAQDVGYDVLFLHKEAADAMADGENPYTGAVEVPDGAPTAEPGDVITGYVYPPITALGYALGEWTGGDPRYVSLIAWLVTLAIVGARGVRDRDGRWLLIMILLAALPGWPLVLRAAWIEPLSLGLLAVAWLVWNRPAASGAASGLALATKQYFVVTAPLLVLDRSSGWRTRLWTAALAIAVTLAPALIWDYEAFWSAAIEFHLSRPPRPDSVNLVGLLHALDVPWRPPGALALGLGLVTAALLGRGVTKGRSLLPEMAAALAVSFLVTTQTFANYWFLVAGLCSFALVSDDRGETDL